MDSFESANDSSRNVTLTDFKLSIWMCGVDNITQAEFCYTEDFNTKMSVQFVFCLST